ncbi:MAG: YkgJ family cysteine cluster protein [Candidatus Nezhaarchaeota archaeon]|nr:YkgJ family cysteine cluster protein [Candidatus Nezhaarchaeota archaeon]
MAAPRGHQYVPWRRVPSWACIRCGGCCRHFLVTLTPGEALNLTRKYGIPMLIKGVKYIMPCKADGSCVFLAEDNGAARCTIYFERPYVCRMYPFHVSQRDLGGGSEAIYVDRDGTGLYVYVDVACRGVGRGVPIEKLIPLAVRLWRKMAGA